MFNLGRPDVLPVDDFGVREGWRRLKGLKAQPKPRALAEIGEAWRRTARPPRGICGGRRRKAKGTSSALTGKADGAATRKSA